MLDPIPPVQTEEIYESRSIKISYSQEDSKFTFKKLFSFVGPAFFVSVGYLDPGNWATDVSGGSEFGYSLLWVLMLSNFMALTLQTLASRLGIVTRKDLAQLCKIWYHRKVARIVLWVICEVAIAATDLAEVIGTAIGLQLLFKIPLIVGVLLTSLDTLLFMWLQKYGVRKLEIFVLCLLGVISMCFIIELFLVKPVFADVMRGFVPTADSKSLFAAIGILGATVMPHNFFLHSSVVQTREIQMSTGGIRQAMFYNFIDTVISLNFAFFVNASILIVASAVFYTHGKVVTELQEAHALLETMLTNNAAPVLFGLGLFCAGQSSTLTGTMAGQIVMEGFLDMHLVGWLRRLITRLVAIVPSVIVIAIAGSEGSYQLLILSQVILSFALPFTILPLVRFASAPGLMGRFIVPKWLKYLSWLFSALIIALNVWGLVTWIQALMEASITGLVITVVIIIPLCIAAVILLVYLAFAKGDILGVEEFGSENLQQVETGSCSADQGLELLLQNDLPLDESQ